MSLPKESQLHPKESQDRDRKGKGVPPRTESFRYNIPTRCLQEVAEPVGNLLLSWCSPRRTVTALKLSILALEVEASGDSEDDGERRGGQVE